MTEQTNSKPHGKRILIVEDEKPLANALKKIFTEAGFDVSIADDGEQALRTIKDRSFDLILLDIIMPKKDGFAFLELLGETAKSPMPIVMIMSNLGQELYQEKAKKLGAVEYLVKANSPMARIVERVEALLHV